jgi:hypothetical protein
MRSHPILFALNRGIVSPLALARSEDLKRVALGAEEQTNWMPRTLGPMMLRPGLGYTGSTHSNRAAFHIPFIFSTTDTAILEITDGLLRVKINETPITRVSVSTAVANGNFDANVTSWTDNDEAGATSAWATGGYLSLIGTGTNAAIRDQQVTVAGADQNKEHALRIVINRGPVILRVGSSSGGDDYISETTLYPGNHSLAFTPTGNFHIRLMNRAKAASLVDSVNVESAGIVTLTTPWGASDIANVRWSQSGDVVFCACTGYRQRRIERRASRSWSIVEYLTDDGPFRIPNTGPIRLTPSALSGDITLTASASLFRSTHVGALFSLTSTGQQVSSALAAEDTWTDPVRVTGISGDRALAITISGTWVGTVTLQRSVEAPGTWTDVTSWASNQSTSSNDGLDNQVIYYRLGFKTGQYTSGTATCALNYGSGSITGVVRVTGYTSATQVSAAVLTDLGGTASTDEWSEGAWSDRRGWPSAVALHEGRLWWAGKDSQWGSVSDAFSSFDPDTEGDAGPISRSIGSGPVDTINWLLSLQRLIVGGQGAEISARSSSLDEPLTPTNFNLKEFSTQGSSAVPAVKVDSSGVFVQRGGTRIYLVSYDGGTYDFVSQDLTVLAPQVGEPSVVRIAVQRQPDTRIHAVRSDGTAAVMVFDKAEDVKCWVEIETDGSIEDVVILPGTVEDKVYYCVARTINGSTVRYLERWALESECTGGTVNKQADSFVTFTNSPASTTVSGLSHLVGESVVVWQDGICPADENGDIKTFTVSSGGTITLDTAATTGIVGLPYSARFKSTKLARGGQLGTALTQRKKVSHVGLILANTHAQGLQYGPDFDTMDDLPQYERHAQVDQDSVWESYDADSIEFPGAWDTDSRICLKANAPRPCTVLAVAMDLVTHEK